MLLSGKEHLSESLSRARILNFIRLFSFSHGDTLKEYSVFKRENREI